MRHFEWLRTEPWNPTFTWVGSTQDAAFRINSYHEDHPKRVPATKETVDWVDETWQDSETLPSNDVLREIHRRVFGDKDFAGTWREVDVTVGPNGPPRWTRVEDLMDQLEEAARSVESVEDLADWYHDFETITPSRTATDALAG